MDHHTKQTYQLPSGIVSRVDVGRLLRELHTLDTFLRSAEVREAGTSVKLPKTSKLFDEFLEINKKNALKTEDREAVSDFLRSIRDDAPVIHMSFSADPSPLFTKRLIEWLRQNIHGSLLLQVGLQPNIGAGTIVRTTNKYFDFSLREFFTKSKPVLLEKLRTTSSAKPADGTEVPAQAPTTPAVQTSTPPPPPPATSVPGAASTAPQPSSAAQPLEQSAEQTETVA